MMATSTLPAVFYKKPALPPAARSCTICGILIFSNRAETGGMVRYQPTANHAIGDLCIGCAGGDESVEKLLAMVGRIEGLDSRQKEKVIVNMSAQNGNGIARVEPVPAAPAVAEDMYSAEVRAAAAMEMAKEPVKRRYGRVFTPEVLDIWQRWVDEGKGTEWIAENNGLVPVANETVRIWLKKHQDGKVKPMKMADFRKPRQAAAAVAVAPQLDVVETAVSEPEPMPAPAPDQTAEVTATPNGNGRFVATKPDNLPAFLDRDNRPPARPLDGLAALLQLVQSDHVKVRGSVKLNLEVEFGGES